MSKAVDLVESVLDRMVEAIRGPDAYFQSHHEALYVPRETIKSWKRRGAVPLGVLESFSRDHKVSLDWLLHGDQPEAAQAESHQLKQNVQPYGLSADEAVLLESYRRSTPEVQAAALRVLAGVPPSTPPIRKRPATSVGGVSELPTRKFKPPRKRGGDTG